MWYLWDRVSDSVFEESCPKVPPKHVGGGGHGNHTHDTGRPRNIIKSLDFSAGNDDFICGHCGSVVLEDFDPSTVRGNPVYQCPFCENNNDLPFAATNSRHWSSR
jgi:hypothetical protein